MNNSDVATAIRRSMSGDWILERLIEVTWNDGVETGFVVLNGRILFAAIKTLPRW